LTELFPVDTDVFFLVAIEDDMPASDGVTGDRFEIKRIFEAFCGSKSQYKKITARKK
jgi:hypothetical protein